ncbi:MAG TPA: single-stranded DNA-binding protein [Streptosporangiaceae bacterium]|nr:single-stranded DNA-binding protein [Streptosporangiaceae bacterium]
MNEAQISLTGYVATQPLSRTLKNGVTTLSMRVAWTPRRQDRVTGEWVDGQTSYVTVNCWRRLATNVAVCVRKGDPVAIQGRVTVRPFDDREGRPRISVEIEASSVAHDLNHGVSQFSRIRPQTGMTASEFAASQNGAGDGNVSAASGAGDNGSGADRNASGAGGDGQGTGGFGGDRQAPDLAADGGDSAADSAALAAVGSWTDGENGIPMPDEPAFFNSSAPSEDSVTGADTERAPEALAS